MMYLNQFKLKLYQTYKDLMEEVQVGLLIQSQIRFLVFENTTTQLVAVIFIKRIRPIKKGLIYIQYFDGNECFDWCLNRHRS